MGNETKERLPLRMKPETSRRLEQWYAADNCRSKNEFVEKALRFYCGYLSAHNSMTVLPPIFANAIRGTIQDTENRICRLLFKLAVEMDMMMNVLAAAIEVEPEQLKSLRSRCVQDVKKTNGSVTLDKAAEYQRGENT